MAGIPMPNSLVETKVATGSASFIFASYLAWALVNYVDDWAHVIPQTLQGQLPFMIAWLLATYGMWQAPHTHRPDLAPVTPPPPSSGTNEAAGAGNAA
jgi:hypothetical protein